MHIVYEQAADQGKYHYLKHKKEPQTRLHFHSARELVLVKSGVMFATIDGADYEIAAGNGCFIDRFRAHTYSHEDAETEVFIFVGDGECFDRALGAIGGVPPVVFSFRDFDLAEKLVRCYEEQKNERGKSATFTGIVSLILSRVFADNEFVPERNAPFSENICEILNYLELHHDEDLSLNGIAKEFGYSPQHFSRLFHKYLQINLSEYLSNVRARFAERRIAEGKTVAEAAFLSGFQSLKTFYRAYKRVFGVAPIAKKRQG